MTKYNLQIPIRPLKPPGSTTILIFNAKKNFSKLQVVFFHMFCIVVEIAGFDPREKKPEDPTWKIALNLSFLIFDDKKGSK